MTPSLDKTPTRHQFRPRAHDPTAARCLLPHILLPLLLSLLARHGRPTPKPPYGDEHTGTHGTAIWRPTSTTARRFGYTGTRVTQKGNIPEIEMAAGTMATGDVRRERPVR